MKIYAHPSRLLIPAIFSIAAARSPLKEPDIAVVEKKTALFAG